MKIALVTNKYPPFPGGVAHAVAGIRSALEKTGSDEVTIVTFPFKHSVPDESIISVPVFCSWMAGSYPLVVPQFPLQKHVDVILDRLQPDVVHIHNPFFLGSMALTWAQKKGIPCVFSYHSQYGSYAHCYAPIFKQTAEWYIENYVARICSQVSTIIAPSCSVKIKLLNQGIKVPIEIIPSPMLDAFIPIIPVAQKYLDAPFQLLCVSRFVKEKNLFFILDVMSKLDSRFVLTLVGYGPLQKKLEKYAYKQVGIPKERLRFIVNPAKTEIAQLYQASHFFIFASTTETQGIVFAESMAAGTPVIALDAPGARDIVTSGVNGFLAYSLEEMVHLIHQAVTDPSKYQYWSQQAMITAREYFPASIGPKISRLYYSLLE